MKTTQDRILTLQKKVKSISPAEASTSQNAGAILIDIRNEEELSSGTPKNAMHLERSFIEFKIESAIPNKKQKIILLCQAGNRSLFAAYSLQECGYKNIFSMEGGFSNWKKNNLPIEFPKIIAKSLKTRFARHFQLPEMGEEGQNKLLEANVLIVGMGGLGCPAALYLTAAGVGHLGCIDADIVEISNLQRQIIYTEEDIGELKVEATKAALLRLNSSTKITTYAEKINKKNIEEIISQYDVVIDGTDDFQTRYLLNDYCVKLAIPLVHGSIFSFNGMVTVFSANPSKEHNVCYRCLFPDAPAKKIAPSCAENGVLGVLPGVIGILQATEAIKLILGLPSLVGRLLYYDAMASKFTDYQAKPNAKCVLQHNIDEWIQKTSYDHIEDQCFKSH